MTARLELRGVSRSYRTRHGVFVSGASVVRALEAASLVIAPGETLGLVGESGCGKSTLARIAAGLDVPDSGEVIFEGRSVPAGRSMPPEMRRAIQMIFQDPYASLNPRMSVGRIIGEGLAVRDGLAGLFSGRAARQEKVRELMRLVGLAPEHYGRFPHQFSGGQRQRVAIARALAPDPRLIVCDEPVSALDVSIQAQVLNLLLDLRERLGLSYLFISHDLGVIGHLSDRVAVMYLGRIVEEGPTGAFFAGPLHPYSRMLMDSAHLPGTSGAGTSVASVSGGPVGDVRDVPASWDSGCAFAPRCPQATDICLRRRPEMTEPVPGRRTACCLPT